MLADRVGIIDHGHIVAEGTPAALKAEIGRPTVEAVPADRGGPGADRSRARPLRRAGRRRRPQAAWRCGCARASPGSRTSCARSTPTGSRREPDAARALARRRLPGEDRPLARGRRRRPTGTRRRKPDGAAGDGPALPVPSGAAVRAVAAQVGALALRSITRTPASRRARSRRSSSRSCLMAVNAGRPRRVDRAPRLPDRLVPRLRARRAVHPGRALRDDERRHRPRARHPDRLPQPALADADARRGAARRAARRRSSCSACSRRSSTSRSGSSSASTSRPAPLGDRSSCSASRRSSRSASARSARSSALRTGSGEAIQGLFPVLFVFLLPLVDEHAAQPDRGRLVPRSPPRSTRSRT